MDRNSIPTSPPAFDDPFPMPEFEEPGIPPTEPNIWNDVLQHRQNLLHDPAPSRSYSGVTSRTRTAEFDEPEEVDDSNISQVTVSDRYFGIDEATQGLDQQTLLRAEELVDLAVNGEFTVFHLYLNYWLT
jgi:hypothetical protein